VERWQAPLKYAEWDAEMVVERAAADGVTVLATAPVGTTPRAVFHSTVMGPSSMQVGELRHSAPRALGVVHVTRRPREGAAKPDRWPQSPLPQPLRSDCDHKARRGSS
jgi:hypothetical protein